MAAAQESMQLTDVEKIFAELTVELNLEIWPEWTLAQRREILLVGEQGAQL